VSYAAQLRRVFGSVVGNRELRRVLLAFVGFNAAEWGVWIALLVYAYARGGAAEEGIVAVIQLVPAALFALLASSLGDRKPPLRVLAAAYVVQSAAMGATATVLLASGPAPAAYALAAVAATAVTITRPTQAVLLPALARTPDELTAANVASGWIESVGMLAAPALAAVLLGAGGAGVVFAVMAAVAAASALLVAPLHGPAAASAGDEPVLAAVVEGVRVVAREPGPRALVWLLGVEAVAIGALDVLYVVLAVAVLGHSGASAGYLNAAFGAGGVAGVAVTVALVGRQRLVPWLLGGLVVCSAALGGVAATPSFAVAGVLLAVCGVGRTTLDVAGRTLLQRVARPDALARVFGLLEGVSMAGIAVGSAAAAALVAFVGGRGSFVFLGAALPLGVLVVLRGVLGADRAALPTVEIARLRAQPLFAALGPAVLEALARSLEPVTVPAGTAVVREGETGDRFYLVAEGELEATRHGVRVGRLERGDCFGEIALLRGVPRTATVTALTAARLDALSAEQFLAAVTGHPQAYRAAEALVQDRLAPVTAGS